MNLSEIFIRRPIMTALIMVSILFFGIMAYKTLPVSDLPNFDYPTIQVTASYPGANPDTMANNVVVPLEKKFLTIEGIQSISSTSSNGYATVVLQFHLNKSMDIAAQDVQAAINQATPQLPQDLPYSPTYAKVNPSASPVLFLTLTSSMMTASDLYDYADTVIGQRLNTVEGVAQVILYGYPYAVRIQLDPNKLAAKGIGIDEVAEIVKAQNVNIPTGTLYGDTAEFTINASGQILRAPGYETIIVKNEGGNIVRLSDLGRALDSTYDDKYYLRYILNGKGSTTIVLAVQTQPGANALSVIDGINEILPGLVKALPGSVEIHRLFDKSEYINEAVDDVQLTLVIAFALVVLVIFIYLGKAIDTIIPSLALPICIVGTFAVMSILGYSIDILSLLAITLSIGFLVDDAIVVLENIVRHVELGQSPLQAALKGSKEISLTILSMTLCLASVFIPMLFMGGVIGRIFSEFASVIFVAVLISGFVSLTLTPMLSSRLIPAHNPNRRKGAVERFSHTLNHKLVSVYERSLSRVLTHKIWMLGIGITSVIATLFILKELPKDFLPVDDIGFIEGFTQAPDGTSPFQMNRYQEQITEVLQKNPYVDSMISLGATPNDNQGVFFLRLKPINQRPPIQKIVRDLYFQLYSFPGAQSFLRPSPLLNLQIGTESSQGDYQYTLQSINEHDLFKSADALIKKMKDLPGFIQVTSDLHISQPQMNMEILRDRASILDVDAYSIETALSLAFGGINLSPINDPNNQYYVIMELEPKYYKDPNVLSMLYVLSNTGKLVPLDSLATITQNLGPLTVNHLNGLPSVTITFSLGAVPLGTALDSLQKLSAEELPPTVSGTVQGSADVFRATFKNLSFLLLITLFVIYIILGILYENTFHPITVMSTLPPAALGGLLTLLLFNEPLSLYPFVGIIMLLGIVMKNGIIMIDFANESIAKEGKTPEQAIHHACVTRFRPILMTTIAALMGAVPIALGIGGMTAQSRRPLGLVIIGGLIFSQILTLYLTPVTFLYVEALRAKCAKWRKKEE